MNSIWIECLREAWAAYGEGSVPVGALWVDASGQIVVRGRNRIHEETAPPPYLAHTRIAHAEINVLVQVPPDHYEAMREGTLYTSLEPCPLCMGAIVMSGVREVRFGARDREAGSTMLLDTIPYMKRKNIRSLGPTAVVESVSLTLMTAHLFRINGRRLNDFLISFRQDDPCAVDLGTEWFHTGYLDQAARRGQPVEAVINAVLGRL
ncbi:MAG: nucleoside deaminase [Firmicutes bacterium]|nr:nucleoside deaminase [Bacillota bacterium]